MNGLFGDRLFDDILTITKNWRPKKVYKGELQYRDDLLEVLRKELNKPRGMFDLTPQEQIVIKKRRWQRFSRYRY